MTQEEFNQMLQVAISQGLFGYYTSEYSNVQMDEAVGNVLTGVFIVPSSTSGSTKRFQITVNDSGTVSATEVTQ